MVGGNTVMRYKDALNELERHSPGTKAQFLFGFLDRVRPTYFEGADADAESLAECAQCGQPTSTRGDGEVVCAFCRTRERVLHSVGARPAGGGVSGAGAAVSGADAAVLERADA